MRQSARDENPAGLLPVLDLGVLGVDDLLLAAFRFAAARAAWRATRSTRLALSLRIHQVIEQLDKLAAELKIKPLRERQ